MTIGTGRRIFTLATIFSIAILFSLNAFAQSGGPYEIKSSVIAGGGGSSGGGTFSVEGTIGQSLAGGQMTGSPFAVSSGFWYPGIAGWNIDGEIIYGTSSAKRVPRVNLGLTGSSTGSIMSNLTGVYQLAGLFDGGSYTITPTKTGLGDVNGITPFDSTLILRHLASGGTLLTGNQLIAGDSNGSGGISPFDSTQVLRYLAAGSVPTAGTGLVASWRFLPTSRNYTSLSANASAQNFDGILVGEVNGSWVQPASIADGEPSAATGDRDFTPGSPSVESPVQIVKASESGSAAMTAVTISIPAASSDNGTTVVIPVILGNGTAKAISGYAFGVTFNPAVLQPASPPVDITGTLTTAAFNPTTDVTVAGRLGIAAASANSTIAASGTLINLRFTVVGTAGTFTNLTFTNPLFDDDQGNPITATPTSGTFIVSPPTASSSLVSGSVVTADGRPVRRALVSITGSNGESKTVSTGMTGSFRFPDVASGQTYIVSVLSKSHTFAVNAQVITVSEDTTGLVFVADPPDPK